MLQPWWLAFGFQLHVQWEQSTIWEVTYWVSLAHPRSVVSVLVHILALFSGCMYITSAFLSSQSYLYQQNSLERFIPPLSLNFPVVCNWCAEFLVFILDRRLCSGLLNNHITWVNPLILIPGPQFPYLQNLRVAVYLVRSFPDLKFSPWVWFSEDHEYVSISPCHLIMTCKAMSGTGADSWAVIVTAKGLWSQRDQELSLPSARKTMCATWKELIKCLV